MHLAILYFLIFFKQYKWLDYEFMNVPLHDLEEMQTEIYSIILGIC